MADSQQVSIRGQRVRVTVDRVNPTRPTFAMVHGIGMSGCYFAPLAARLGTEFGVVRLDLPGFGFSSRPSPALTLAAQASIVRGVLDHLDIATAVLVGHSLGCQIALKAAVEDPRVAGLVLVGPTANRQERTVRHQLCRLAQDSVREPFRYNAAVVRDYLRCSTRCYLQTLGYMVTDRPEDDLEVVRCPVVLVRGARDRIVPATWTDELAAANPRAVVRELPGAPHGAHVSAPQEVAAICASLL